jgi:hypothetical protein
MTDKTVPDRGLFKRSNVAWQTLEVVVIRGGISILEDSISLQTSGFR